MKISKQGYVFFIIVFVNLLIKLIYADATPYSFDEIISVKNTVLNFGFIKHEAEWDNNPPFYYYCLWVWHKIIPVSEFNSRLLSVIFVSFATGAFYLFVQKQFNTFTAISSAVILSLSNMVTYYAQETRTYSLVLLLAILSTIVFFKYLRTKSIQQLLLLSLINFLLIYSHYISAIVILVQFLTILIKCKKDSYKAIGIQTLIIGALVFLRFTKKQFLNIFGFGQKEFWLKEAGLRELWEGLSTLYYNNVVSIVFVIVLFVFLYNLISKRKSLINPETHLYILLLGLGSVIFLFLIGMFKPVFLARYLIFSVPFAVMAVCYQLNEFKIVGRVLVAAIIVFLVVTSNIYKNSGSDYKSVAGLISKVKRADDKIIVNTRDNILLMEYYTNRDAFLKYKNIDSLCESQNIYGINDLDRLKQINFNKGSTIFLLQSFQSNNQNTKSINSYLDAEKRKVYNTSFFSGINFTVYKN